MAMKPESKNFLQPIDLLKWGGYVVGAVGTLSLLSHLGVDDAVHHVADSVGDLGKLVENNQPVNNELLKKSVMGAAFIFGCAESLVGTAATVVKLNKSSHPPRLSGNHGYEIAEDGVRVQDSECGDGRISALKQMLIELGAGGLMQGIQLENMLIATGADKLGEVVGDNIVTDMLTGYYMGRNLPPALASTMVHAYRSLKNWAEPATREHDHSHNLKCGMTAAASWWKFNQKFSDAPAEVLDTRNNISQVFALLVLALEQSLFVPMSGFKHIRYMGEQTKLD
jgi:hypothetical protein